MLSRKYKLKKKTDFSRIFKKGKYFENEFIRLKILRNDFRINRFGFIVGLKISKKAVERNKIKRRLEEIIRLNQRNFKSGFDIVVLIQPEILEKEYNEIKKVLINLFQKANLILINNK